MKNFIAAVGFVAMSIAIIILIRAWLHERRENDILSDAYRAQVEKNANEPLEIIRTVIDTVYEKSAATVRPIETTDLSIYVSRSYADSLSKALNIAVKDINRLERFKVSLQDSIEGILSVDSNGSRWASLTDKIFDIRYNFDTNIWYPKVSLDLEVIGHKYKPNFFARRQVLSTIVANDRRVEISNIRQVNKITLPSRFGLDVMAGAVFTPQGLSYGIGAGIGYRIWEF